MPELQNNKQIFSLSEVSQSIRKTIAERYSSSFWVRAELNKLNYYKHSGHCYPELVEKSEGKVVAQFRSTLWREDYFRVNQQFLQILHEPLQDGIKVLLEVRIVYDAVHGLSLSIQDVDPTFTLGDLEREKQESIFQLKQQNLYYKNRTLQLPLLPKRIAIISVETSKGYSDFMQVISQNEWNYKFFTMLFPAVLQGEKAVVAIQHQLKIIEQVKHHFDVVAIVRGGGGDVGLSCYNHFDLASSICNFPLPVVTGIGHSTNETVTELVAHYNAITPTKLAEFFLQHFHNFAIPIQKAKESIQQRSADLLLSTEEGFRNTIQRFKNACESLQRFQQRDLFYQRNLLKDKLISRIEKERGELNHVKVSLSNLTRQASKEASTSLSLLKVQLSGLANSCLQQHQLKLQHSEHQIELLKPEQVLKRGYSITRIRGKSVQQVQDVNSGDEIETVIYNGKLKSIVTSLHEEENKH